MQHYFFSGAGFSAAGFASAGFSGAGAGFSSAGGGVGFASSFGGAGFGGSADGPHPINEKPAKKAIAIINATSFFIYFHLLSY
jgi:hypothetical protein